MVGTRDATGEFRTSVSLTNATSSEHAVQRSERSSSTALHQREAETELSDHDDSHEWLRHQGARADVEPIACQATR